MSLLWIRKEAAVLLRFEVANHRSIMDAVELSMIAVDRDRPGARRFDRLNESVLTTAGIYGPNASGKSNVLDALVWLSDAVHHSLRAWNDFIPRQPFRFGGAPTRPSTFELEMIVHGVRYAYRLEVDDQHVLFEGLYSYPERRRRILLEREEMELVFRRGLGSLAGARELLTPTTLALSAAMRLDGSEVGQVGRAIANIRALGPSRQLRWNQLRGLGPTIELFAGDVEPSQPAPADDTVPAAAPTREGALALLRFADLGIDDVEIVEVPLGDRADPIQTGSSRPRRQLRFLHRVADEQLSFGIEDESAGTQTWFQLIGPVLAALRSGHVVSFDEVDASLHPRLSARLLELFHDPKTNPHGAQLVFSTHDTSLLNRLNRDEVWLTEKGGDGATSLTALAEYGGDKVRRSLNLERAYLQGRFGAVPEPDQSILRRALGVAEPEA